MPDYYSQSAKASGLARLLTFAVALLVLGLVVGGLYLALNGSISFEPIELKTGGQ